MRKVVRYTCPDYVCVEADEICRFECLKIDMNYRYEDYGPFHIDVKSNILPKIFDYCKERAKIIIHHHNKCDNLTQQKLKDFDSEFLKQNHTLLVDLMDVAVKLHVKTLIRLMIDDVVDIFKKMTPEEIYEIFGDYPIGFMKDINNNSWVFKEI